MATKPLPTIATDQQGRPVKQDSGEALLKNNAIMVDVQKMQLDVLTDILGVMKNIADNLVAGLRSFGVIYAESFLKSIDDERSNTTNKLAEAEKEREAKLGSQDKPESLLDSLKKLFDDYFGVFKTVFNVIRLILLPMILGFVVGFRKKFDLLTVAIGLAIFYPIRAFKLMSRVFGFLYEMTVKLWNGIKIVGTRLKDIAMNGPKLVKTLFNDLGLIFLRIKDAITGSKAFKFIASVFAKAKNIFNSIVELIQPMLKFVIEGRGIFGKMLSVFKLFSKVLGLPLTIILGVFGGITGAIEGFKKEGILGGIKGLFAGAIDGAFGWIFDAIGWVFGKLGYEESEKALKEFNLFRLVSEIFDILFMPLKIIAQLSQGKVPDFMKDIWDTLAETIRNILITLGETLPGGDWLLSKLGIEKENKEAQGRKAAPQMYMDEETRKEYDAIDTGNEQVDNLARSALEGGNRELYEKLTGQGFFDLQEGTESAKKLMMESGGYTAEQIENIAQTGYIRGAPQAIAPANKAELIGQATREAEKAKQPEPPKPTQNNTTVVNAPNNSKTTANMNPAPHADRVGIGSRGNAAYAGFGKSY